jgi:hypothetical protein
VLQNLTKHCFYTEQYGQQNAEECVNNHSA